MVRFAAGACACAGCVTLQNARHNKAAKAPGMLMPRLFLEKAAAGLGILIGAPRGELTGYSKGRGFHLWCKAGSALGSFRADGFSLLGLNDRNRVPSVPFRLRVMFVVLSITI